MIYSIFFFLVLFFVAIYFSSSIFRDLFFNSKKYQYISVFFLLLIPISFLTSFSLIYSYENNLVRVTYFVSAVLLGFLFYLTFFSIIGIFLNYWQKKYSKKRIALILLIFSFLFFIIGLFQAFNPKIKRIEVNIKNLPTSWQGKKIVHISDVHLGIIYGGHSLQKLGVKIDELKPDILIISGDLFDGNDGELKEIAPYLSSLKAKEAVIFVPGNHDHYLGLDKIKGYLKSANILMLQDEARIFDGLEIIGLDFHNRDIENDDIVIKNFSYDKDKAIILVNHVPDRIDYVKQLGTKLQLSGHTHRGQIWPLFVMTRMIYGVNHYGLHTYNDFNINTSSGVGSWGPPIRTFNQAEIVEIILK